MRERPCDCCVKSEGYWNIDECLCGNIGDTMDAQAWCSEANAEAELSEKDKRIAELEAKLNGIKEAAEAYNKMPIDIQDRAESWGRLDALLKASLGEEEDP